MQNNVLNFACKIKLSNILFVWSEEMRLENLVLQFQFDNFWVIILFVLSLSVFVFCSVTFLSPARSAHPRPIQQFVSLRLSLVLCSCHIKTITQLAYANGKRLTQINSLCHRTPNPAGIYRQWCWEMIWEMTRTCLRAIEQHVYPVLPHLSYPGVPDMLCVEELCAVKYWNFWSWKKSRRWEIN